MCKALPPLRPSEERDVRRMQQAAAKPGVREFGRLVADARRLAFRISEWMEENPVCELTETNLALMVAIRNDLGLEDISPEHHRALGGMLWTMEAAIEFITGDMLECVFPECHEDLRETRPAPRSKRKPSQPRCLAIAG